MKMRMSLTLLSGLALLACESSPVPNTPAPTATLQPENLPEVALGATTDGETALRNLDAQIEGLQTAFERHPQLAVAQRLLGLLLSRTHFTGRYNDFDDALALTDHVLDAWGHRPEAWLMRADALSAVHRFDEAQNAVAEAQTLGASAQDDRLATYGIATGRRLDEVLAIREAEHAHVVSFASSTGLAAAAAALGDFERADALYREALEDYNDVSPMPLAWVMFQRGVMWGEKAARADLAHDLYAAAVELLPGYVVANVHLAEIEWQAGGAASDDAIARLSALAPHTEDPEPAGKLAGYLQQVDPEGSATFRDRATAGYDLLLESHYEAFLDHASEFFAGPGGDAARALTLALENLASRQDARAYVVALGAAEAAGDRDVLCELTEEAGSVEGSVNLGDTLYELQDRCD